MKIISAEITGFKLHKTKKTFEFGQVNYIIGGNGKGKTTISEAIAWCFYGCDLTGKTKDIFARLKNNAAKETKVRIGLEMPTSDGGTTVYDFCRIRNKTTSLYLNGHDVKQMDFDGILGPMELFLSIFIPGYFGTIGITEPTKARNMLVSMLPKLENDDVVAKLSEDDQARIEALDMINPNNTLKNLRTDISELDKSLENVQGKIDYLRNNSMLNVPKKVMEKDEHTLSALKEAFAKLVAGGDKPFQNNMTPFFEKKAELKIRFEERSKEFKALKEKPLPQAGDHCPACDHAHSETEAKAEFERRKARLLELQEQCEAIKAEGHQLNAEIEEKENENEGARTAFEEERGRMITEQQAEIDRLQAIVSERAAKLKMAEDLVKQHEIYGEIVTEREEKKVDVQAVYNFMLQYAEMQVEYVNSFLNLAKIQLFKFSGTTGEMQLDFIILYGEADTEYKSLSTSEKIRCSIELAGLLNRVRNVSYPVFIDNAESVESFDKPTTQYFVASVEPKAELISKIVAA
jgi:DNA repair exonuclease SbcCD ATPase subunit